MRYLFFDIECCNGRNICEFGYVITDESFNVIEKQNFTINPEARFNLIGRPNRKDLVLYYPEHVYFKSYKFDHYYNRIKELLTYENQIIIGHSISNDAGFLRTAWKRYECPKIDFKFYDSQKMYAEYFNLHRQIALEEAGESLNISKPNFIHKSDEDSFSTMQLVKSMCQGLEVGLLELIELCTTCSGKIQDNEISFDDDAIRLVNRIKYAKEDTTNMILKGNYRLFFQFLDGVKPQGQIIQSELNGKTISISKNYEIDHFKEMLSIIQLIVNRGGTYKLKASQNDYFVKYYSNLEDGSERFCTRLNYVNEAISQGKNIKIITFDELLAILSTTEEDLSKLPFPEDKCFLIKSSNKSKKSNNNKKSSNYIDNSLPPTTLGDIFRSKSYSTNEKILNIKKAK